MKIDEKVIYNILKNKHVIEDTEIVQLIKEMSLQEIKNRANRLGKKKSDIVEELVDMVLRDITYAIIESLLLSNNVDDILNLKIAYLDSIKDCKN